MEPSVQKGRGPGPSPDYIESLFADISTTYDKANDFISLGLARSWRARLVKKSGALPTSKVLDCATGTGDLAFDFKRILGPQSKVVGCDFCQPMLDLAQQKAIKAKVDLKFEKADLLSLPYASDSFDYTSIAYGIRNVADAAKGLREMARVTRPGGKVMILETGETGWPIIQQGIHFYFSKIVPVLGGWISGNKKAYQYLNQSSLSFPSGQNFIQLMQEAKCFSACRFTILAGGASFIYEGEVSKI